MKRVFLTAAAAITLVSVQAAAQPRPDWRPEQHKGKKEITHYHAPGEMAGMMRQLNLTDSQCREIAKLDKKREKNREALIKAERKHYEKSRKAAEKAFAGYDKQMRKILSPEQYSAWKKGMGNHRHDIGQHRPENRPHIYGGHTGKHGSPNDKGHSHGKKQGHAGAPKAGRPNK